jgi:hypothetical protein
VSRPALTVIAGANGAGKSTLTSGNPGTFAAIPLLDPDAFANTLRSSGTGISTIAAGKEVLRLAKEHLKQKESFAVETTPSGKNYLQMMQYARALTEALRWFSSTLGPKALRSTWLESPSVFWQVVTTFLRWTFVGAISAVFRICRPPLKSLIEFYSSTTPIPLSLESFNQKDFTTIK